MRSTIFKTLTAIFFITALVQCDDSLTEISEPENLDIPALTAPDNDSEQPTSLSLEWESIKEANTYDVRLSETQDFSSPIVTGSSESTTFEVLDLPSDTKIYWQVRPNTDQNKGSWSEAWTFTTASGDGNHSAPASTNLKTPENGAANQSSDVTLEWASVTGATGYKLEISTDPEFGSLVTDETVESNSYKADLSYDKTYFWRVEPIIDDRQTEKTEAYEFATKSESNQEQPPATNTDGFVSVENGDFVVDGEKFRFAGTNSYHLPVYEKINSNVVDQSFRAFEEAGLTVIRTWGFYDGAPEYGGDITLQPEPGVYNEEDLKRLDNVIAKAKEHGVRVILAFTNNWGELGGVPQYNEWDGNPGGGMSHFINDEDTQKWFKDYISMLVNRTNTVTGVKYKEETAIFAWEIMNEARLTGGNPEDLRDWYQEIAQFIKSEDPNHMVSTGEEGYETDRPSEYSVDQYNNDYVLRTNTGSSYKLNTAIPEIDYGTAHWYPSNWGFDGGSTQDVIQSQRAWISDHSKIAEDLGKPFVLGEYGYEGNASDAQLQIYKDLWDKAEQNELDGSLLWQFTPTSTKCYEYPGNICWPDGRQDEAFYNSFFDHIQNMNNSK